MTYFESAKGLRISRERALLEVRRHHCSTEEFLAECGQHDMYDAQAVLEWLGY